MMRRVFCVVLALTLLCCCLCVFAAEEEVEEEVLPVDAVCAGDGENVGRWQLRGRPLWYNCTAEASGLGKMICGMGAGNCAPEDVKKRVEGNAKDGVFEIKFHTPTPGRVKSWWESNVEPKPATAASGPAKPAEERPPVDREEEAPRDTTTISSGSSPAGVGGSAGALSLPPTTPRDAGANAAAGAAGKTDPSPPATLQAQNPAPSGELQGAAHSASAASKSPPDPEPTESGEHSSHDPPAGRQEETVDAPPTRLSQTGEDGGAAEGAEEDTADTTDAATSEGNATAAGMPAPLSSAPTTKALENSAGNDACFHDPRLHTRLLLVLAALTYGTLG
ncbi:hypothetical protein Tc00.1047053508853.30 [Trypanosoma cruzi]|uniref:90 kDa surface protein n=1 Tax=Trypanosoma cruzi (strain CL Brener) TaxID=353153 RepID=Q4CWC7_TRYCC|nr:hypothetical protein Tc00.1047053508853.30 [Trypanosoma cruzi]EAN84581.1 hypothetical protein Tc00.1047053508853.30 [Trypanosoma cruzi]|eukprot:XP_806432.1 hypothetical protein [Trypanosoma cruzi strain CL Brener]